MSTIGGGAEGAGVDLQETASTATAMASKVYFMNDVGLCGLKWTGLPEPLARIRRDGYRET
jgi:hypothetical protein